MEKEVIDTTIELLEKNAAIFKALAEMRLMPFTKDQVQIFYALSEANRKCVEVFNHLKEKP